jgi:hypothetical protein
MSTVQGPFEPTSAPPSPIKDFEGFNYEKESLSIDVPVILKGFGLEVSGEKILTDNNWILLGTSSKGENTYLKIDQFVQSVISYHKCNDENSSDPHQNTNLHQLLEKSQFDPLSILKEGAIYLSSRGDEEGSKFLSQVADTYQNLLSFCEQLDKNPTMLAFDPEQSEGSKLQSRLNPMEMLLISLLSQSILKESKGAKEAIHVKKGETSTEIPKELQSLQSYIKVSFIIDPKTQELTLLSKSGDEKASVMFGGCKKVTAAVTFSPQIPQFEVTVQAVNKKGKTIEPEEISLMRSFSGVRGLQGLRSYATYEKNGKAKQSLVMDRFNGSIIEDDFSENIQARLDIALDVAYGLEYLHEKGYKHGDIKPENILKKDSDNGSVKAALSDYGNTKKSIEGSDTLGTVQYAPPEAARGEGGDGKRADMYALGVTLYEQYLSPDETTYLYEYDEQANQFVLNPHYEDFMTWAEGQRERFTETPPDPTDKELRLHFAICKLLDPDPETRPTAQEVRLEIEFIKNSP